MKKMIAAVTGAVLLIAAGCSSGGGWDNPIPEDAFIVVGHRGASAYAPENTLPSFALAKGLDADYIELDIHETKDGELVVMHDDDVSRTTDSGGKIKDMTLSELKDLSVDVKKKEKIAVSKEEEEDLSIPTLDEVFDAFGKDMRYVVELKDTENYPGIEEKAVRLIEKRGLIGEDDKGLPNVIIHSFDQSALVNVHKMNPEIPLLQLISFDKGEKATLSKKELNELKQYASGVGVSYEAITPEFIALMKGLDFTVFGYTVNDRKDALQLKKWEITGIHTDEPDILKGEE